MFLADVPNPDPNCPVGFSLSPRLFPYIYTPTRDSGGNVAGILAEPLFL